VFVLRRLLLLPAQLGFLLVILYSVESFLTAATSTCRVCFGAQFVQGLIQFVPAVFLGNWGTATSGRFQLPVTQLFAWWLPDSVELGLIALAISLAAAYPIGLWAGWRPGGPIDVGSRGASVAALLVPTFLVALLVLSAVFLRFVGAVGDLPYGTVPSDTWWALHGGPPPWLGIADQTAPTGFPLVDGIVHGAWAFEVLVLAKVLLQAGTIALVYTPIFLRYLRFGALASRDTPQVTAARSWGVPESALLWRHAGRQTAPSFVLAVAATLPLFLGTQAVVEVLYGALGVGPVFLQALTSGTVTGFPLVLLFLLAVVVLLVALSADVIALRLDPRLPSDRP
jgi:peptide/nickel transport system permease protein